MGFQQDNTRAEMREQLDEQSDRIPLGLLVDYETNFCDEYVHVVPDEEENELHIYRAIERHSDEIGYRRVHSVISDVRFHLRLQEPDSRLVNFYLNGGEAHSLLTFLNSWILDDAEQISLTYYEDDGRGFFAGNSLTAEAIYLQYSQPVGVETVDRETLINSTYECPSQMVGRFSPPRF